MRDLSCVQKTNIFGYNELMYAFFLMLILSDLALARDNDAIISCIVQAAGESVCQKMLKKAARSKHYQIGQGATCSAMVDQMSNENPSAADMVISEVESFLIAKRSRWALLFTAVSFVKCLETAKNKPSSPGWAQQNSNSRQRNILPPSGRKKRKSYLYFQSALDSKGTRGRYNPNQVLDENSYTSWCVQGSASISLYLPQVTMIQGLMFRNGRQKVAYDRYGDRFAYNHRAAGIQIEFSNGKIMRVNLQDKKDWQLVNVGVQYARWVRISLQSYYAGQGKSPQTCISDIKAYGY